MKNKLIKLTSIYLWIMMFHFFGSGSLMLFHRIPLTLREFNIIWSFYLFCYIISYDMIGFIFTGNVRLSQKDKSWIFSKEAEEEFDKDQQNSKIEKRCLWIKSISMMLGNGGALILYILTWKKIISVPMFLILLILIVGNLIALVAQIPYVQQFAKSLRGKNIVPIEKEENLNQESELLVHQEFEKYEENSQNKRFEQVFQIVSDVGIIFGICGSGTLLFFRVAHIWNVPWRMMIIVLILGLGIAFLSFLTRTFRLFRFMNKNSELKEKIKELKK